MSAKQKIIFTVAWGACGKCGISLGENPSQEAVTRFLKKHSHDDGDHGHLPRMVGYVRLPSELKGRRVSVVLVAEPKVCRYKDCMNYKKGTEDYCSPGCKFEHKRARLERKRQEEIAAKQKKLAKLAAKAKAEGKCKRPKCKNYSKYAADYCSRKCEKKDRRQQGGKERQG